MNCSEIKIWILAFGSVLLISAFVVMVYFAGVNQGIDNFKDELRKKKGKK